jgi:WD40 repeat protein
VLFLISRKAHGCGSLVSAGADGYIRFWDTNNGTLVYERKCTKDAVGVLDMVCDTQEKIIYVGDSGGQISLWNIEQAGIKDKIKGFKENNMMLIHSFVGHKSAILSISLLEAKRVILTLGQDQTLRLFTVNIIKVDQRRKYRNIWTGRVGIIKEFAILGTSITHSAKEK